MDVYDLIESIGNDSSEGNNTNTNVLPINTDATDNIHSSPKKEKSKIIFVNASDVSGITGYNQYSDIVELTIKYLYKGDTNLERQDILNGINLSIQSEQNQVEECLKLIDSDSLLGFVDSAVDTSDDLVTLNQDIHETIELKSHKIDNIETRAKLETVLETDDIESIKDNAEILSIASVKTILEDKTKDNAEKVELVQSEVKNVLSEKKLTDSQVESMKKVLSSQVNTSFGTRKEHYAIKMYEQQTGNRVVGNNDKLYKVKIKIPTPDSARAQDLADNNEYFICGKVDGIVQKVDNGIIKKILIEVKNRKNRIFKNIPYYDQVQTITYMKMLGLNECDYIQCLNAARGTKINISRYQLNDHLWKSVLERLTMYIKFIYSLRKNKDLRFTFVQSDHDYKREIISEYCYWITTSM
jgi:hypothetical protein